MKSNQKHNGSATPVDAASSPRQGVECYGGTPVGCQSQTRRGRRVYEGRPFGFYRFYEDPSCFGCRHQPSCITQQQIQSATQGIACRNFAWAGHEEMLRRREIFNWRGVVYDNHGNVIDAMMTDSCDYMKIYYLDAVRRGNKVKVEQRINGEWLPAKGKNISDVVVEKVEGVEEVENVR